jgi:cell division protein FtsQ
VLLVAACALAAGYVGWFRDSSFVQVEEVTVTGLTTRDAPRVRAAIAMAARDMTTLHVRVDELERAVRGYPAVRELRVQADFPNALSVRVIEHRPVALLVPGRVPVAADGTVLRGVPVERRLPTVAAGGALAGDRVAAGARALVLVAAAAPAALRGRVERVRRDRARGLVADVRDGPEIVFGDAGALPAKWLAAARVLADPGAAGASYVDVRLPERPVAGGLAIETIAPVAPAGAEASPAPVAPGETGAPAPAPPGTTTPGAEAPAATSPPPSAQAPAPPPASAAPQGATPAQPGGAPASGGAAAPGG